MAIQPVKINPSTISGINLLPAAEKRSIYTRMLPPELFSTFHLTQDLVDASGNDLLILNAPAGRASLEISLYHQHGFPDPVFYGHLTDTLNGYLHILLYVINDPASPRFDVDRLPDGTSNNWGAVGRNLSAELASMQAGLAPGQIRRGLRLLAAGTRTFEAFIAALGHDLYFAEPLHYHNAIIFERYGFSYQQGRKLMERIQAGFSPGGDLLSRLDGSSPFRQPAAANSIRLRSWAIHDGLLGEPFTDVTMYKRLGKHAGLDTSQSCPW